MRRNRGETIVTRAVFGRVRHDGSFGLPLALAAAATLVILLVPLPRSAVVLAAAAALVVALVNPPLALGLLVASVPVQSVGGEPLGSINLTLTKFVLLATAAAWLARVLTQHRPVAVDRIVVTHGLYVVVLALSIVNAPTGASWGAELYRWWSPLLTYMIAINTIGRPRDARPVIAGTAFGVAGASVFGIVQAVRGLGPEAFDVGGWTRAYATFGQPNPFAGYLELTVPLLVTLCAAWLLPQSRPALREAFGGPLVSLSAVGAGLGLIALVLSQSRGGWLGALAGLTAVAVLLGGRIRWTAMVFGVSVLAAVVLTPYGNRLSSRLGAGFGLQSQGVQVTPENFAVQERLAHWRAGWAMAKRYPVLGVGAGSFPARFREFTHVWRFRIQRGHAHNAYIHAAAQTGFVGLAAYLVFVGGVATSLYRSFRRASDPAVRVLVVGAIGVSLALAVHNVFDYLHVHSLPVQLAAVWALAAVKAGGTEARPLPVSPSRRSRLAAPGVRAG